MGAALNQLNYQAKWELVVMWIDDKFVDDRYITTHRMLIHEMCYNPEIYDAGAVLYASLNQHRSGVKA